MKSGNKWLGQAEIGNEEKVQEIQKDSKEEIDRSRYATLLYFL